MQPISDVAYLQLQATTHVRLTGHEVRLYRKFALCNYYSCPWIILVFSDGDKRGTPYDNLEVLGALGRIPTTTGNYS